ncbi:MAG TPA: non-canonical purine NTP pyrophosphatase [Abditibacteriaceae bacterium]|jgi:XTP/dITP diphosphohydrolase
MTILLATTSKHKAREIAELLSGLPDIKLETLADYPATEAPEEDGETMAENARIKAQFYAAHFGKTVLADDSGLEVDALNGEPGVHSARWVEGSDNDRNRALLDKISEIEPENRGARYRCALCLASPTEIIYETEGTCEGAIALLAEGFNGFGYDSIFQITLATGAEAQWVGQTLGQASPEVKASVSHRSSAVRLLAAGLIRRNFLASNR